jgi:hypothetical protein
MDLIYLDYNCFQRGFDDPRQIRIKLEALACEEIFKRAELGRINLVWSFMHDDENSFCPFLERKVEALRLSTLCKMRIGPEDKIYNLAQDFQLKANLSSKDAIHLACAYHANSNYFLTCDIPFLKRAKRLNLSITILNPLDYIREVEIK